MDRMRRHTKAIKEPRVERREKGGEEELPPTSVKRYAGGRPTFLPRKGAARPCGRLNMALAGNREAFFRALRHIRLPDPIRFRTAGRSYEYRVDSTEIVRAEETRVLDPIGDAILTLVTCYPFEYVGHAPNRFIVRASRSSP